MYLIALKYKNKTRENMKKIRKRIKEIVRLDFRLWVY